MSDVEKKLKEKLEKSSLEKKLKEALEGPPNTQPQTLQETLESVRTQLIMDFRAEGERILREVARLIDESEIEYKKTRQRALEQFMGEMWGDDASSPIKKLKV